jgi:hypothetical protein
MKITGLSFPVQIDGDVTNGGPAVLQMFLGPPLDEECFDQLRCVVAWFAELAERGAFGGVSIKPASVLATLASAEPDARSLQPSWRFDQLRVDPAALTSLASLAFASRHPIKRLVLTATGASSAPDLSAESYVGRWPALPFKIAEDVTSRSVELAVEFLGDLADGLSAPLIESIKLWAMVCALGGFRGNEPLGDRPDLVPDDDPFVTLDQLTFTFRDYGIEPSAYDALFNMLGAFAARQQGIASVTVS